MISIIMPVWNGSRFLDRAIASVLAQTSPEWELVVLDDASIDDSVARIERWRQLVIDHLGEEKIRLFSTGINSGSSVAQNMGVEAAQYDIIAYLHCDDILFPRRVEGLCWTFRHPGSELDLVFSPYEIFENGRAKLWNLQAIWEKNSYLCSSEGDREPPFAMWAHASLQQVNLSVPLGVAHRREIFEKVGGFQPGIVVGNDGVLWRRMANQGARIGLCPVVAGRYYVRSDSQARTRRPFSTGGFEIQKDHPLGSNGQYLDAEWYAALESRRRKGAPAPPPLLCFCRPRDGRESNAQQNMPPAPFIVGVSRSGTTLLRLMLDAHPELAIPPETHFIPDMVKGCRVARHPVEYFLTMVTSHARWKDHHLDAGVLRQRISNVEPFHLGEALRIFYRLYAKRFEKPRWGDKTPEYLVNMSAIQQVLPEARFIHIIRDGRDVALSIKDLPWGPNSIAEAAMWWGSRIQSARNQADDLQYYLEIRYEDLLLETETTLRRVCSFIDLPWNPAVLDYHQRAERRLVEHVSNILMVDGRIMTAEDRQSYQRLTKKPPDPSHIGLWKAKMMGQDRKQFVELAGETLRAFGYEIA